LHLYISTSFHVALLWWLGVSGRVLKGSVIIHQLPWQYMHHIMVVSLATFHLIVAHRIISSVSVKKKMKDALCWWNQAWISSVSLPRTPLVHAYTWNALIRSWDRFLMICLANFRITRCIFIYITISNTIT